MPIADLCKPNVLFIEKDSTIEFAARLMREHHVGGLVVVESANNNQPVGVITDRDIVIHAVADGKSLSTKVSTLMSKDLVCIDGSEGFASAISQMEEEGIRRLVVLDETGQAMGLISADDVIQILAEEMSGLGKLVQKQADLERMSIRSERILSTL